MAPTNVQMQHLLRYAVLALILPACTVARHLNEARSLFSGDLTFYGGAGQGGACSSSYVPDGYTTVAMNNPQYSNGGVCGACVKACYQADGGNRCFNAIVDNLCPECASGSLDLGEGGDGRWPVQWRYVVIDSATVLLF